MQAQRVAVVRGGTGDVHPISMLTGAGVRRALQNSSSYVKDIVVSRKGELLDSGYVKDPHRAFMDVDAVFIALYDQDAETTSIQRVLDQMGIPYTGSAPYATNISSNKALMKEYLKHTGVKMPRHLRVTRDGSTDIQKVALSISELFGPQYVVKPQNGGVSIGTHVAHSPLELGAILVKTLARYSDVIVEEKIVGKEASVGIMQNFRGSELYALPPVEVILHAGTDHYSTIQKLHPHTRRLSPGSFSRSEKDELMDIARTVHTTLGLHSYSSSDFIVASDGVYFIEVNAFPLLLPSTNFSVSLESVGSSLPEFIDRALIQANHS